MEGQPASQQARTTAKAACAPIGHWRRQLGRHACLAEATELLGKVLAIVACIAKGSLPAREEFNVEADVERRGELGQVVLHAQGIVSSSLQQTFPGPPIAFGAALQSTDLSTKSSTIH